MTVARSPLLQLFAAERGRVIGLINRIVGCRETAEDLAQDALLRLWDRPVQPEDRSLLFRTAQNLAIDHVRAERVRTDYRQNRQGAVAEVLDESPQPEAAAAAAQEFGLLTDALQDLPERTRRIFLLNRVDGLSYAVIARQLGLSVSTVEKEMMRALDQCRGALERDCR